MNERHPRSYYDIKPSSSSAYPLYPQHNRQQDYTSDMRRMEAYMGYGSNRERLDERRDDVRRDMNEERRDDKHNHHPIDLREKRRDLDKEERDDRLKRLREHKYGDTLELNMDLQLKIKGLKEEVSRYKAEIEHLRRLVDAEHQDNLKLKREVSELEEDLSTKKYQIKDERSQREIIFRENEQLIKQLEAEVIRLRMMCTPLLPPVPPLLHAAHMPLMPIPPPMDTLSFKIKERIAKYSERCIWISSIDIPKDELARVLGGPSVVDSVYMNPRTTAAFVLFHSTDKAVEGVATARMALCVHNGLRCNMVNSSIWIGNLHCGEDELRALCASCGEVEHVKMMPNSHCAFASYKSIMSAITACCELDGVALAAGRILVNFKWYHVTGAADLPGNMPVPYVPVCHVLYVGDLDHTVTRDELLSMFVTYGDVQEIWMPKGSDYAFVTYGGVEEAVVAKYHLQGRRLGSKQLRINYRKNIDVKTAVSESVTIKTVPPLQDEEKLRAITGKYGKIAFISRAKGSGEEWIVAMGTIEEAIILKGHLHSRSVSGFQFSVEYLLSRLKTERVESRAET